MKIVVTGGAGFIGSNFIYYINHLYLVLFLVILALGNDCGLVRLITP